MQVTFETALKAIEEAFPLKASHLQRLWASCARESSEQGGTLEGFIAGLKERQAESAKKERALRAALREKFDRYRITVTGAVEVYGTMPNTNQAGWYTYGDREQAAQRLDLV